MNRIELEKYNDYQRYSSKDPISMQLKDAIFKTALADSKKEFSDPMVYGVRGVWYYQVCANRIAKAHDRGTKVKRPN